jgi:hypothetical protein
MTGHRVGGDPVTGLACSVRHGAGGRTIGIELENLPALIVVAGVKRAVPGRCWPSTSLKTKLRPTG